jgi:nucleoside-diphosphate-sugar epimerase
VAFGYDRAAGLPIHDVYVRGLANLLAALPPNTGRIIYVSSTGVYGRTSTEVVNEETPCEPTREGGIACWEAEKTLLAHPLGVGSTRLRLAGIYGPGRIPFLSALAAGNPIATPADSFLNLIHVDDAANVVTWAADQGPVPSLYVVSDGHPVLRREFYEAAALQIGAPAPGFVEPPADTPQARRAAAGDKQVDSRRLWHDMRATPRYATFREGLAASLGGA